MAQQIKKKFIGSDQVGANQLLIESGEAVRAMDGATEVELIKVSSSEVFLKGIKVLDSSNLIPSAILPSYVDDVLEFADLASFPATGESGKIYVALDTNKQYRWSGSVYVQITSGAVDSVNGETGIVVLTAGDIGLDSAVNGQTDVQSALDDHETRIDDVVDDVSHLVTLSGVAVDSDNLGSFTGSTIADNQTVKAALQDLETAQEEIDANVNDLITLSGVIENSANLGSFTGDIIADDQTIKSALQDLETELVDTRDNVDDLITLSGVLENAENLGSFTGSTIADNQSIKSALQDLETAYENHLNDSEDAHDASAISFSNTASGLTATDVQAAIDEVEGRVQTLEEALAPVWARQKFDLTATDISNGYVDLAEEVIAESIHAFVDRLAIHQGEDFTVSVVGGVTRITFAGDLVSPGQSQLDATDNIYIRYQYLA